MLLLSSEFITKQSREWRVMSNRVWLRNNHPILKDEFFLLCICMENCQDLDAFFRILLETTTLNQICVIFQMPNITLSPVMIYFISKISLPSINTLFMFSFFRIKVFTVVWNTRQLLFEDYPLPFLSTSLKFRAKVRGKKQIFKWSINLQVFINNKIITSKFPSTGQNKHSQDK